MWGLKRVLHRRYWRVFTLEVRAKCAEAGRDAACAERDAARAEAAAQRAAAVRTAGRNTALAERIERLLAAEGAHDADIEGQADRIDRLVRACARYRADLARAARDNALLQARLDDACGVTAPAVLAWRRAPRPDVMKEMDAP
ncbi:hypothetical protein [Streptomyces alboflavus]|uniref:hypothetical protein n=1 Tax=Streptomyces alboflavus TaxID=67267 RepID=UPI00068E3D14|nr:hypothetical protein [Streptomyces alboflavus]